MADNIRHFPPPKKQNKNKYQQDICFTIHFASKIHTKQTLF